MDSRNEPQTQRLYISMGKVDGIANSQTETVQEQLLFSLWEDVGQSYDSKGTISMPRGSSTMPSLLSRESGRARLQRAFWGYSCTESRAPFCHHTPWKSELCILRRGWGGRRERKWRKASWSPRTLGPRQERILREGGRQEGKKGHVGGGEQQWVNSHRVTKPWWEWLWLGIDSTAAVSSTWTRDITF